MRIRLIALSSLMVLGAACAARNGGAEGPHPTSGDRLTVERIALRDQPLTIAFDRGHLWATTGRDRLLRLVDGDVVERFPTGVSRVGIVRAAGRLWLTGGGDGDVPDGSVLRIEPDNGEIVQRISFPHASPYGIEAAPNGIFAALFHGELVRMHPGGDATARISLGYGLTQLLVAHNKVWVSSPQRGKVWSVAVKGEGTAAATKLRRIDQSSCPQGLDSTRAAVWVADPCAGRVWLLDPGTGKVEDEIGNLGHKPLDIDISKKLAWVVSFRDDVVSVLDADSLELLGRGKAGPGASAVAAHGRDAWVTNSEDYSLTHMTLSSSLAA